MATLSSVFSVTTVVGFEASMAAILNFSCGLSVLCWVVRLATATSARNHSEEKERRKSTKKVKRDGV